MKLWSNHLLFVDGDLCNHYGLTIILLVIESVVVDLNFIFLGMVITEVMVLVLSFW